MQPSKSATETRGSVAVTALAASGTSVLSTAPLASGGAGTASAAPAAPSAAKAPLAGALAGVSAVPSAAPGGTAAGRGLQRLAAQLPGLTELIAPTVSISTPLPSPGNPSSDPSTSQPPPSPPPSTTTPPPSAPAPGRGSATLSWTLNSETDLAGYKIYVGTAPGRYTYTGSPFTIGVTGTYTIAGLPSGQTYYFAVSAYDYFGAESGLSSEVSKSIY